MQAEDVVKQIYKKLNEEFKKMGHVNIVISGKTGVGKSTLVNAIFGKKIAETGTGRPITQEIKEITTTDYPLRLYDTVGLELSEERQEKVKNDEVYHTNNGIQIETIILKIFFIILNLILI